MYFVYILISEKDGRTYTGYSKNVKQRLKEHSAGRVKATKHRRPLKIFLTEEFDTEKGAKDRELWWKSSNGRKELKKLFKQ